MKHSNAHLIGIATPKFNAQIKIKLFDGYGVEDIAIWLDCHVDHIRKRVQILRDEGILALWWGR